MRLKDFANTHNFKATEKHFYRFRKKKFIFWGISLQAVKVITKLFCLLGIRNHTPQCGLQLDCHALGNKANLTPYVYGKRKIFVM